MQVGVKQAIAIVLGVPLIVAVPIALGCAVDWAVTPARAALVPVAAEQSVAKCGPIADQQIISNQIAEIRLLTVILHTLRGSAAQIEDALHSNPSK